MGLRFIYGRSGCGKTGYCFKEINEHIENGDNDKLILLVPEDYSFQAEKNLLKTVGEKGLLRAQVLSFKRMAYKVFSEIGGLTRQHMSTAGRSMLIYKIMEKYKGEFNIYGKAAGQQGFVDTISKMITEFKTYGIIPEMLLEAADKIDGDDVLKTKLKDICLIYREFENTLHKNFIDSDDDLTMLAEKLERCSLFDGCEVWMDGFTMLTPQQVRIVEKLIVKSRRFNVTLCTDILCGGVGFDSSDVFYPVKNMEGKLLRLAEENGITYERPVRLNNSTRFKSEELEHLEKNYYGFPYDRYEKPAKDVSIFKAVNKYTEVQYTARDIVRLCREEGYRYSDIAVVTKDVDGYEKLIGAIFREFSIPYFLDKKRDIDSNPLVVLIISAIEILNKNWSYESVFKYLKTGLTGMDREDIDLIENYVLACGIKGRRWIDGREWEFWPEKGFDGNLPEGAKESLIRINNIRNKIICPLMDFYNISRGKGTAREMASALFEFLCSTGVPGVIERLVEKYKDSGELAFADEYSKVWNILIEALDQVVEVVGDESMDLLEFTNTLSIGLKEYKIGLIPSALDQVMFGAVERLKSHDVKALYIIGVNDGIFPSSAAEEGILSDRDRMILKSLGVELAPGSRDEAFEQQFLVYTTLSAPSRYLKVTYPIADHEGKTMRPSISIAKLKRIFPSIKEDSNIVETDSDEECLEHISKPVSTFNELIAALRKGEDKGYLNPVWKDVYRWYMEKDNWRDRCLRAISARSYTNQVGVVSPSRTRELYGKKMVFSISRLEKFSQCPFSYFVQYGLKAKERRVFELSPPDLGSFIHSILDKFSEYLEKNDISWRSLEKEWCSDTVSAIVDQIVDSDKDSIFSSSARFKYLKERLKRIVLRAVWLISLHIKKGSFEPEGHEIMFGYGGDYPPISIELPSGEKIDLIGRIDRLDTMECEEGMYVRIVDYKTGNKKFNLSDIYNGLELQLLIYLDAILEYSKKHKDKKVIPGGMLYFKIDDPIIRSEGDLTEEDIEKEIMKKLKMKGLLLSDVKVIREMDREADKYSLIIPAVFKGDGTLGSKSSTASAADFEGLRGHVRRMIVDLCEDMLKGNIIISPVKNRKQTPCDFCSYKSICRFDVTIKENNYRIVNDKSIDEIWDAVRREAAFNGRD